MRPSIRPPEIRIASERLELRPPVPSDVADLVSGINDFAVSRMLARVPYPYTRADAEAFLGRVGKDANNLALMITQGARVIGAIGLSRSGTSSEFGYWIARAHWGVGYASEACRAFLGHVFATEPFDTIRSGVFVDNPGSLRVQKKLGFVEIGKRFVECLARGNRVEHIDTILTRARFQEATS